MINRVFERIAGLKVYIPLIDQGRVGRQLVADAVDAQQQAQFYAGVSARLRGLEFPEFTYPSLRAHEASADQRFVAGMDSSIGDLDFIAHHKAASLMTPGGRWIGIDADGRWAGWRNAA